MVFYSLQTTYWKHALNKKGQLNRARWVCRGSNPVTLDYSSRACVKMDTVRDARRGNNTNIYVFLCAIFKGVYSETWIYFQINTVFCQRDIALKHMLISKNIRFSLCYSQRAWHWNIDLFKQKHYFFPKGFCFATQIYFL